MTLSVAAVTLDCDEPLSVAGFWSAALRMPVDPGGSPFFASINSEGEALPRLLFCKVPEGKTVKNRVHIDLMADDRDAETARLVSLGATMTADKDEWGHSWTVMADPEGNEFCVSGPRASA